MLCDWLVSLERIGLVFVVDTSVGRTSVKVVWLVGCCALVSLLVIKLSHVVMSLCWLFWL